MNIDDYSPKNSNEYITCFRQLAALISKAMIQAETTAFVSENDKKRSLQRLAEAVETIACLRGDSGLFGDGRPENLAEFQKEMYQIEDALRTRLIGLGYKYPV